MLPAPVVFEAPFVAIFDRAAVFSASTFIIVVIPPSGQIAAWFRASVVLASISFAIHWASAPGNGHTLRGIVVAVVVVFTGCVGFVRCDGFVVGGLVAVFAASVRVFALDRRFALAISMPASVRVARGRAPRPGLEACDVCLEVCAVVIGAALESLAFLSLVAVWIDADLAAAAAG